MSKKRSKREQQTAQAPAATGGIGGKIRELIEFFEQSKVELKKITWPTRKDTIKTCVAVLAFTIVMAVFLGVVDLGVSKLVRFILS